MPRAAAALAVTGAATLLALMNYTAPMSTFSATAAGLRAGPAEGVWLISSISVGLSAVLLVVGSMADDHGRKRVFVAGTLLLGLASTACAMAPGPMVFILARIAQGAASAGMLAAGLGIIGHSFRTVSERTRATGVWGAMLGAGITLGPIVSAWLTELSTWRLWYWATAAGAVLLAAVAVRAIDESRAGHRRRPDLPGVITLTTGLAALVAAITAGRSGWLRPGVLLLFAAAAVLLTCFTAIESRRHEPMLDLALFRRPGFVVSTIGALFTGLAVIGIMSFMPTVLDRVLGLTPFVAALLLAVWSGGSFAVALQARRLAGRVSGPHQVAIGLLICAAGELALLGLDPGTPWWRPVPGLAIAGVGSGLLNAVLARLAVESVPAGRSGMGSGANNTARYVGASIGVAVVMAVATAGGGLGDGAGGPAGSGASSGATGAAEAAAVSLAHGADTALIVSIVLAVAGAALSLLWHRPTTTS